MDLSPIREASEDVFQARAAEAIELGLTPRYWPPTVTPHTGWEKEWAGLADKTGLDMSLDGALEQVNEWVSRISVSGGQAGTLDVSNTDQASTDRGKQARLRDHGIANDLVRN